MSMTQLMRLGQLTSKNLQPVLLAVTAAPDSPQGMITVASPFKPWGSQSHVARNTTNSGNRAFEINLDVQYFMPEDISVKTVDGFLIIEANHEEREEDIGWVKRHFTKRYALPEGCNIDALESHLSSDGILTVKAPPLVVGVVSERIIPIVQTGPVRSQADMQPETGRGEAVVMPPPVDTV